MHEYYATFEHLSGLPYIQGCSQAPTIGTKSYWTGGYAATNFDPVPDVYIFDSATNLTTKGPRMKQARSRHGASKFDDESFVVCGGYTNDKVNLSTGNVYPTNSCERFVNGTWTAFPSLLSALYDFWLIGLGGGRLVAFGSLERDRSKVFEERISYGDGVR